MSNTIYITTNEVILWMRNILLCLCTSSFYPFIHSHTLVSSHPLATVNHVVINREYWFIFCMLSISSGCCNSWIITWFTMAILSPVYTDCMSWWSHHHTIFLLLLFSYSSFTGVRCCLIINLFTSFQLLEEWKMVINIMKVYNICFLDVSIFCLF